MAIDPEDLKLVKSMLFPGEDVAMTVRQRKFLSGGSIINPTSVIVTDRRIIIINRMSAGLRKDYEVIAYGRITSVRMEKGFVSSNVFVRVEGYDTDVGLLHGSGKEEGEIDGLTHNAAQQLVDYLNKKVAGSGAGNSGTAAPQGKTRFCSSCGAKIPADAKFCNSCGAKQ